MTKQQVEKYKLQYMANTVEQGFDRNLLFLSDDDIVELVRYGCFDDDDNDDNARFIIENSQKVRTAIENRKIMRKNVENERDPYKILDVYHCFYSYLDDDNSDILDDEQFITTALELYPISWRCTLEHAGFVLHNNRKFMINVIYAFGYKATMYASIPLRGDPTFIKDAINASEGGAFRFGWVNVRNDSDLASYALEHALHPYDLYKYMGGNTRVAVDKVNGFVLDRDCTKLTWQSDRHSDNDNDDDDGSGDE